MHLDLIWSVVLVAFALLRTLSKYQGRTGNRRGHPITSFEMPTRRRCLLALYTWPFTHILRG